MSEFGTLTLKGRHLVLALLEAAVDKDSNLTAEDREFAASINTFDPLPKEQRQRAEELFVDKVMEVDW